MLQMTQCFVNVLCDFVKKNDKKTLIGRQHIYPIEPSALNLNISTVNTK